MSTSQQTTSNAASSANQIHPAQPTISPAAPSSNRDVWKNVKASAAQALSKSQCKQLDGIGDYDTFALELKKATEQYRTSTTLARVLKKLDPALNHLKSFSDAIKVMIQQDSNYLCLVWGTLIILIDVSIRFLDILEQIVDMLVDITDKLPRFDLYVQLFSNEKRLKDAVSSLYEDYVMFCLETIKFLKRKPFKALIRLLWSPVQRNFNKTKDSVKKHSDDVEDWAKAAHYAAHERHHQEIIRILPKLDSKSKTSTSTRSIPQPRNPKFFGRDDILTRLFNHLKPRGLPKPKNQLQSVALHGFGGVGKTQVANEFVHRYMDHYPSVFWFRSETPALLKQEFADAARRVGVIEEGQSPDLNVCIDLFKGWLFSTDQDWLMVLDNVDEWDHINDFWPSSSHGSLLLTTRNAEIAHNTTEEQQLTPYSKIDGTQFLLGLLKDADDDVKADAKAVADEIDGYPLALSHAAGYVLTHHITCAEFLEVWRDIQMAKEVHRGTVSLSSIPRYPFTIEDVWTISLGRLPHESRVILDIAAFLDPDQIQLEIIQRLADTDMPISGSRPSQPELTRTGRISHIGNTLRALTQHTLLNVGKVSNKKVFSIHRLLQRDLLLRLQESPEKLQEMFRRASRLIRIEFPTQHVAEPMTPFWPKCKNVLPHVMRLQSLFRENELDLRSEEFASLLGDAAYYQWEKGLLKDALDLCYLARDILEEVADETSIHKADVLNVIGAIYIESGAAHIDEGTDIMLRVLQIRRNRLKLRNESDKCFEEDYICVSNALSNLSCCWIGLKEWQKGFEAIDESIKMFERFCTEESHPYGFSERYANLGQVLAGLGKLDDGLDDVKKATELHKRAFGQNDVRACVFESYWGNFLLEAGRVEDALKRHQAALDIRVQKLGPASNDVAKSLYFVARCRYLQGQYDEANELLLEAIAIYARMYWTENRVARALFLQSMVFQKQGLTTEAEALRKEAGKLRYDLVKAEPQESDTLEMYEVLVFYH